MKGKSKEKIKAGARRVVRWIFIHRHAADEASAALAALKKVMKTGKATPEQRADLILKTEALIKALRKAPAEEDTNPEPSPSAEGSPE